MVRYEDYREKEGGCKGIFFWLRGKVKIIGRIMYLIIWSMTVWKDTKRLMNVSVMPILCMLNCSIFSLLNEMSILDQNIELLYSSILRMSSFWYKCWFVVSEKGDCSGVIEYIMWICRSFLLWRFTFGVIWNIDMAITYILWRTMKFNII